MKFLFAIFLWLVVIKKINVENSQSINGWQQESEKGGRKFRKINLLSPFSYSSQKRRLPFERLCESLLIRYYGDYSGHTQTSAKTSLFLCLPTPQRQQRKKNPSEMEKQWEREKKSLKCSSLCVCVISEEAHNIQMLFAYMRLCMLCLFFRWKRNIIIIEVYPNI